MNKSMTFLEMQAEIEKWKVWRMQQQLKQILESEEQ